ncbi:MAG TPA: serine/threonine-protein kinase [Polyangiaceae bacterium]|nr:serine/threonine-protein kinase [Polyangiaceae bacterium]
MESGRVIAGKYAVQSIIGEGAMGVVYRAKQVALDKSVALKVLSVELRDDPEFVMRFHTEARAASRLDHPNSTRVIDFGEEPDGLLYIAMELLEGRTLAEVLEEEWPLPPARTAAILTQVLSAVGAAHALKILHRDLKPENIVILEGRDDEDRPIDVVKVCDFGIAKVDGLAEPSEGASRREVLDSKINATRAGVIIGTPQYMSPEQARGEKLDVRSDLYALGVVLYEILTRRAPFDEGTAAEVLYNHATVEPQKPSAIYANVDPHLEQVCLRALRKKRDERWPNAREMRAALRPMLDTAPAFKPLDATTPAPPPRIHDGSIPTISATAVGPPPKSRSRIFWALPAIAIGVTAYAMFLREHAPRNVAHAATLAPTQTQTLTQTQARTQTQTLTQTRAPSPTAMITAPGVSTSNMHRIASIAESDRQVRSTAPVTSVALPPDTTTAIAAPPPPPETTVTPPPPPPPATTTAAPPPPLLVAQHADPARVHVDIGSIQADRVGAASVNSALQHIDFTGCYRTEVSSLREADGTATLVVETDEERITRADLVGGPFAQSLRSCIAQRTLGTRIRSADTGGASARVALRFVLR